MAWGFGDAVVTLVGKALGRRKIRQQDRDSAGDAARRDPLGRGAGLKAIVHRNREPLFFVDERALRAKLWEHTVAAWPDWALAVDADEVFEDRMQHEIGGLLDHDEFNAVDFRLFHSWRSRTHYRVDGGWNPWPKRVRMLFHYRPEGTYTWPRLRIHCDRIPLEARREIHVLQSDVRKKHFGWATPADIERKYRGYRKHHDDLHLRSVMDPQETVRPEP